MKRLPHRDVVIVGLGWTGSILAHGLAEHGLDVIAIERGPWRDTATDYPPNYAPDELRYHIRHKLFLQPAQITLPSATRRTGMRCRSGSGVPSCSAPGWAAAACTGMPRPGASPRPTSS